MEMCALIFQQMCIVAALGKGDGTDIIKIHLLINTINKMLTKPIVRQQNLLCFWNGTGGHSTGTGS